MLQYTDTSNEQSTTTLWIAFSFQCSGLYMMACTTVTFSEWLLRLTGIRIWHYSLEMR